LASKQIICGTRTTLVRVCKVNKVQLNVSLSIMKYHTMKAYGGTDVQLYAFQISALDEGVSGQLHAPITLPPTKELPVSNE